MSKSNRSGQFLGTDFHQDIHDCVVTSGPELFGDSKWGCGNLSTESQNYLKLEKLSKIIQSQH